MARPSAVSPSMIPSRVTEKCSRQAWCLVVGRPAASQAWVAPPGCSKTRTALVTALVTSLTVAAVLRWRTTVGTCLLLTSETTWLLAAMRLLSEVTTWRVV